MYFQIATLMDGIDVLQTRQRTAREELLQAKIRLLDEATNAGRLAALHVVAVLEAEADRIRRGYGDYGQDGITREFWNNMAQDHGGHTPGVARNARELKMLRQDIANLSKPIPAEVLVHSDLRVLLAFAATNGETQVTSTWLMQSGFRVRDVNEILLAAAAARETTDA